MREILFRGRGRNGEWRYGSLLVYPDGDCFICTDEGKETDVLIKYAVTTPTVGQYTGLTDKHGVKIFEGDICRNTRTGEVVAVKWHGTMAGFVWSKRKDKSYLSEWGELFRAYDKYEIIGNIHDNPELLKEDGAGNV